MAIRKKHWFAVGIGAVGVAAAIIVACSAVGDGNTTAGSSSAKLELQNGSFPGFVTDGGGSTNLPGALNTILNPTAAWNPAVNTSGGTFVVGASGIFEPMGCLPGSQWCGGPGMMSWWTSPTGNALIGQRPYGNRQDVSIVGSAECGLKTALPSCSGCTDTVFMGLSDFLCKLTFKRENGLQT